MRYLFYFWSSFGLNNIHIIIGNSKISTLTLQINYELHIDLEDFNGNKAYAKYSTFYVGGAVTIYKLHVSGYSGTAGKMVLRRLLPIFKVGKGGFGGDDLWLPTVKLTLVVLLEFEEKRPLKFILACWTMTYWYIS